MLINGKKDLQKFKGTVFYNRFVETIGLMYEYEVDVTEYPEDYKDENGNIQEQYVGQYSPTMEVRYRDGLLEKYGLTKQDIGR